MCKKNALELKPLVFLVYTQKKEVLQKIKNASAVKIFIVPLEFLTKISNKASLFVCYIRKEKNS